MASEPNSEDRLHLERARVLARNGWGRVQPNPMVGCVIVRDGEVVGEGFHQEYGGPHAEVVALGKAGDRARGATAYVSLEPCAHTGKTPPCTDALISAGIHRVVYGAPDPGADSGGGGQRLRDAGLEVSGPVLERGEAWRDNPAFHHAALHDTAYLEVKLAISLDGMIASAPGEQTDLTGPEALARVHRLRSGFSAVLVGANTVEVDDPLLTVRAAPSPPTPPLRLVADEECRISPDAALFDAVDEVGVVVFTTRDAPRERQDALRKAGARVIEAPATPEGVDLHWVLRWCHSHDVPSVLCEGGGWLASSFLRAGLCRRLVLYVAPCVIGPGGVPAFPDPGVGGCLEGWRVVESEANVGRDGILVLEPEHPDDPTARAEG